MMLGQVSYWTSLAARLSKDWGRTAAIYGVAASTVGLYFTDWKVVATYIPFYGSKFEEKPLE